MAEQAHLAGPNLTCGFYAAAVDIGRLQDELHRGIQRFDCIQPEERWGEIFTWIRQLLGRWVQRCKRMHIERLEVGIRIGLQTQDDHGYYEYQFDVFCKAS